MFGGFKQLDRRGALCASPIVRDLCDCSGRCDCSDCSGKSMPVFASRATYMICEMIN